MKKLAPVDFKAIAAKGCFVYCYLRSKSSKTAKAGTPCYVGIAKKACRPTAPHSCSVPSDLALIRVMRSELTWEEAQDWERFYVARYGRKDLGTGILLNLTDGGEGSAGRVRTEEERKAISQKATERQNDPEWRALHPVKSGFKRSEAFCEKNRLAAARRQQNMTAKEKEQQAARMREIARRPEVKEKMAASAKLRWNDQARAAWSERMKKDLESNKRYLQELQERGRNALKTPESREKHRLSLAIANQKPEVKARKSEAAKAIAPEVKERVAQARRDAFAKKQQRQADELNMTLDEFLAYKKKARTARTVQQNRERRARKALLELEKAA